MSAAVTMLTKDATSRACCARFDPATTISIFISCWRSIVLESTAAFGGGGVGCWAVARLAEISTLPIRRKLADRHRRYGIVIWVVGPGVSFNRRPSARRVSGLPDFPAGRLIRRS